MAECYATGLQPHRAGIFWLAAWVTCGFVSSGRAQEASFPRPLSAAAPSSPVAQPLSPATLSTDSVAAFRQHAGLESYEIPMQPLDRHHAPPVVTALAASHDGRFIAAAGDDHVIRIIDVATGTTISALAGHTDWIQCLVFSYDSQQLYSAGNDGRILRWNHRYPVSYEELISLGFAIRSISLATEKDLLAVCGFSETVVVWDLVSGQVKHQLKCDSGDQRCVRFSPDGSRLLCGGRLGELRVWDIETGELLADVQEHRRRVFTAAFSADGTQVTSVGEDRRIVRYDLPTRAVTLSREVRSSKLMSMCLINDGMVAVAGADNRIQLFDIQAGSSIADLNGHTGTVAVMCPCGGLLASGSFDTTIRIWNLERIGQRSADFGKPVSAPLKMDRKLQIR
jgi:WD40 repeat protein